MACNVWFLMSAGRAVPVIAFLLTTIRADAQIGPVADRPSSCRRVNFFGLPLASQTLRGGRRQIQSGSSLSSQLLGGLLQCRFRLAERDVHRLKRRGDGIGAVWAGTAFTEMTIGLGLGKIGRASCRKECRSRWSPYH